MHFFFALQFVYFYQSSENTLKMNIKTISKHLPFVFIGIVLTFILNHSMAQRPKVGLVLSGGGAKGISHVGILQAIDSAGLKIDYITGTSMGSIVGGLYAIGYSGKEIERISEELDWDAILSNKPNYKDISIDEKDEYGKYSIEIGLKDLKPQIATGLIESEELWLKFNELFLPVYNIKDFSKFNIPFKCVAADLSNGNAIVLDKGEITTALRSSMAIPSVFTAVEYDSTKLVDGGIIRNFPVTDVKKMGADIVIGVNLSQGLTDVSKLNNVLDVFLQITAYRDAEDFVKEKDLCNLIIEPPVHEYSAGSFGSVNEIMKIGIETGKKYYPYFKHLADSLNKIEKIAFNPENRLPKRESIIIDNITFEGLEKTSQNQLLDKLQITTGKSYTANDINKGFRKAYSSRYYDKVYYHLYPTSPGHAQLHCIVQESAMTQVKAGLLYHSYTGPTIIANATFRNLLLNKSRSFIKAGIGEYQALQLEHNQAFGRKGNRYLNGIFLSENLPLSIYDGKEKTSVYNMLNTQTNINYSITFGTNWSLALGTKYQKTTFNPEVADNLKFKGNSKNFNSYLKTESITTDRPFFPTSGHEFSAEAGITWHRRAKIEIFDASGNSADVSDLINGQPSFYIFTALYNRYFPLNRKTVLLLKLQGGLNINSQGFLFDNYKIGGIQQLTAGQMVFSGLNDTQLNSASAGTAMLGAQYNFLGKFLLMGRANTGVYNFIDIENITGSNEAKWINGFSLGLAYNLSVLPMEYNVMYSPEIGAFYNHVRIGVLF
jgi:NTE family protein